MIILERSFSVFSCQLVYLKKMVELISYYLLACVTYLGTFFRGCCVKTEMKQKKTRKAKQVSKQEKVVVTNVQCESRLGSLIPSRLVKTVVAMLAVALLILATGYLTSGMLAGSADIKSPDAGFPLIAIFRAWFSVSELFHTVFYESFSD